jgi:hypothetical protein
LALKLKPVDETPHAVPKPQTPTQTKHNNSVKAGGAFKKSDWGGEICDALKPVEGDIVAEGKRGLCGFASTNLDFILQQRKIETVALAGFLVRRALDYACSHSTTIIAHPVQSITPQNTPLTRPQTPPPRSPKPSTPAPKNNTKRRIRCVESSMRTSYEKGYRVITLTDCCAATRCGGRPSVFRAPYPPPRAPFWCMSLVFVRPERKDPHNHILLPYQPPLAAKRRTTPPSNTPSRCFRTPRRTPSFWPSSCDTGRSLLLLRLSPLQ